MDFMKKWSVVLLSLLPALAMAHPGHDHRNPRGGGGADPGRRGATRRLGGAAAPAGAGHRRRAPRPGRLPALDRHRTRRADLGPLEAAHPDHRPDLRAHRPGPLHPHLRQPRPVHPQQLGGLARQVDDAPVHERPAIVDAHDDHAAVRQVGDPRVAWDRQRRMGRGKLRGIERFSRCGQIAVRLGVVDGCEACLGEVRRILDDFVAFAVAFIILIRRGVRRFVLRIGAANLHRWAIANGRLWSADRFLLNVFTRTCRQQPCCYADPQPLLTHREPLTRFSTTFFCEYGST